MHKPEKVPFTLYAPNRMRPPSITHAFGVQFRSGRPLPGLRFGAVPGDVGTTLIEESGEAAMQRSWPGGSRRLVDRRHPDGRLFLAIDVHPSAGWRVVAPDHGLHIIAGDGSSLRSALPEGPDHRWQKLLFSQVLPLVATLHGLAVLHAGACIVDDVSYGLFGPSGTGKSSVLMHLMAGGAQFLTDDVLALRTYDTEVVAQPGPRFANYQPHEHALLSAQTAARVGRRLGVSDKVHFAPLGDPAPTPLGGLLFLRRTGATGGTVAIRRVDIESRDLLAQGFVTHQQDSLRLLAHLEACAAIKRMVPAWSVEIPEGSTASAVARAVRCQVIDASGRRPAG